VQRRQITGERCAVAVVLEAVGLEHQSLRAVRQVHAGHEVVVADEHLRFEADEARLEHHAAQH
jgi:hypothetical protein